MMKGKKEEVCWKRKRYEGEGKKEVKDVRGGMELW